MLSSHLAGVAGGVDRGVVDGVGSLPIWSSIGSLPPSRGVVSGVERGVADCGGVGVVGPGNGCWESAFVSGRSSGGKSPHAEEIKFKCGTARTCSSSSFAVSHSGIICGIKCGALDGMYFAQNVEQRIWKRWRLEKRCHPRSCLCRRSNGGSNCRKK